MIKIELAEIQERKNKKGNPYWIIKDHEARSFSTYSRAYMEKIKTDKGGEIEYEERKSGDFTYFNITEVKGIQKEVQRGFGGGKRGEFRTSQQVIEGERLSRESIEIMSCLKSAVEYCKTIMEAQPTRKQIPDWKSLADDMYDWVNSKKEKKEEDPKFKTPAQIVAEVPLPKKGGENENV